jgi:uncharacterized membrane protein YjjP (DUF1212 family)
VNRADPLIATMSRVDGFDVVVRVTRLALASSGEGVETMEQYVARAASAYGIDAEVVVLPEQVVVTDTGTGATAELAIVRAVPGIFRLDQLAALKRSLVGLTTNPDPDQACRELDGIAASPPRWPAVIRVVGVALFAAGFAPSVVASWSEIVAAALLGLIMGVLVLLTGGRALEGMLPFIGAFLVTVIGLTAMTPLAERTGVTLMVLPALFIVVPGDTLSAAGAELLSGRLTAGAVRLVYAFFVLGLIVVGIVAGAGVTGNADALTEKLPPPELALPVILAGWVVFSVGLVFAFNAEPGMLIWLAPSVIMTYLVQEGATKLVGDVFGTLVAGIALGAYAGLVGAHPRRPPRLLLLLGGFFVLTVGGLGIRGTTALIGGDVVTGLRNLIEFGLQVPTVGLAIAFGLVAADQWRRWRDRDRLQGRELRRSQGQR